MRKYNKKANYNANPNYLDFLDAMRKFFTNDQDIIPIIAEFNFYINGVYSTPYTDLFRMYDENPEDIHGPEKTKQFIDDGTVGIINEAIYKIGKGSLLTALENTRVILENKKAAYNVGYNPITKTYTEALKPVVNNLPDGNPIVFGGSGGPGGGPVDVPFIAAQQPKKKAKKSFWKYLSFLSHPKNKKSGPIIMNFDGNNY
jgi:hypothetical protein